MFVPRMVSEDSLALKKIPCQKMFDLGMSPKVGQMNDPQNAIIKMGKLNGSLLSYFN